MNLEVITKTGVQKVLTHRGPAGGQYLTKLDSQSTLLGPQPHSVTRLTDFNPAFPIEKSVVSDRLGLPYIFHKRFKKLCW